MSQSDATIKAGLKAIEELQGLLKLLDRPGTIARLKEVVATLESLPLLEQDLVVLANRLRGMLSSDPDKTPVQGISGQYKAIRPKDDDTR
jgi:hypothetical protein